MSKPWRDKKVLEELYLDKGMSTREIGNKLGCDNSTIVKWLNKLDIPTRPKGRHRSVQMTPKTDQSGYEKVQHREPDGSVVKVRIHRLAAVAWFGFGKVSGMDIHHRNGIPWDNREENIEPISHSEHSKIHAAEQPWMSGSLYDWLDERATN